MGRKDDRIGVGVVLPHLLEQRDAAHLWHLQVGKHQVVAMLLQACQRLDAVVGRQHLVAVHAQQPDAEIAYGRIIFNHQKSGRGGRRRLSRTHHFHKSLPHTRSSGHCSAKACEAWIPCDRAATCTIACVSMRYGRSQAKAARRSKNVRTRRSSSSKSNGLAR